MPVYFDHNATAPLDERVLEAMMPYLTERFGNPSSVHGLGRVVRSAIDNAREQVAALVNAHPSQVVFCSGGTEANNLAIKGGVFGHGVKTLAVSAIEHASVLAVAKATRRRGVRCEFVPVDGQSRIVVDGLREVMQRERPGLVSLMMVNNETGVVQPIAALSEVARRYGGIVHTDAVQAAGKIPVDYAASGVHLMTLSAHKLYGPQGAGALIVDKSLDLERLLHGGGQEKGYRAGTENVAAIVGFGVAAELARSELQHRRDSTTRLMIRLEARLRQVPGVVIFADEAERVSNTVFLGVPGIDGETLLMNLDAAGVAVSSGSACDSGSTEPSHVLMAMGIEERVARGAIRVSLGHENRGEEIDQFIDILARQISQLRSMPALGSG